jgi:hypothetical protein
MGCGVRDYIPLQIRIRLGGHMKNTNIIRGMGSFIGTSKNVPNVMVHSFLLQNIQQVVAKSLPKLLKTRIFG